MPIQEIPIDYRDYHCQCGKRISLIIRPEWTEPLLVMQAIEDVERTRKHLYQLAKDFDELCRECLDAGVKPATMKRADEAIRLLKELLVKFQKYPMKDK